MNIIGFIMIFAIPSVLPKPTINKSESSSISTTNDTAAARTKRQPEFFDFLHQLIDKHANCAEQQLSPLKPFRGYKPYETFIYPNGFLQPPQQSLGVLPKLTQFNLYPVQQQYPNLATRYNSDVSAQTSKTKASKPISADQGKLPYSKNTFKNLPIYGSNRFRFRAPQENFRPQYRPHQLHQNDRHIYSTGLQKKNFTTPVNCTTAIKKEKPKVVANKNIYSKTTTARNLENVLTSYPLTTTQIPVTQNCTCPNVTTSQPMLTETNENSFNLEHNLNLLIQELEFRKNKNITDISTNNKEILKILLQLKALKSSNANIAPKSIELSTTTTESSTTVIQEILTKLTTLQPFLSKEESISPTTEKIKASDKASNENIPATLNVSAADIQLTSTLNVKNSEDATAVKDSFLDLEQNLNDIVAIDGAPALKLNITNSKDLERLTYEMQKLVNELQNKPTTENYKEDLLKSDEINDFEKQFIINDSDAESIEDSQSLEDNENLSQPQFQKKPTPDNILNKTVLKPLQPSDKSSVIATTINVPFKHNGKFKKIHVGKPSSKSSNKNVEISEKENANFALDHPSTRKRPIDMTGFGSRFINFLRKPKVPSNSSFAEPIMSEIYPVQANKRKSKSPLSIYMHKIEEKFQNSNKKPSDKWKQSIPDDYSDEVALKDDYEDGSLNVSKECEDDFVSEETKQQISNLKPSFPELFNYDTNFT